MSKHVLAGSALARRLKSENSVDFHFRSASPLLGQPRRPWRPISQSEKLVEGRLQRWAISDGGHRGPFPGELEGEGVTEGRSWEGKGRGVTEGRFPMGQEAMGVTESRFAEFDRS